MNHKLIDQCMLQLSPSISYLVHNDNIKILTTPKQDMFNVVLILSVIPGDTYSTGVYKWTTLSSRNQGALLGSYYMGRFYVSTLTLCKSPCM